MTIDRLDCEVTPITEVLECSGVKNIDELVDKYEKEIRRLETALECIMLAPSASAAHTIARRALGLI